MSVFVALPQVQLWLLALVGDSHLWYGVVNVTAC